MTRIAIIDRAAMDGDQARVFDAARNSGGVTGGPYYAYIRWPDLFEASQNLRTCLWKGPLSARERQLVTITVARHWNATYPWAAQVRNGVAAGLERPVIDALNAGKMPDLASARERVCVSLPREILANKGVSQATYDAAEKTMGLKDMIAVVALTGNFTMTCLTANTFDVDAPAEDPIPLAR